MTATFSFAGSTSLATNPAVAAAAAFVVTANAAMFAAGSADAWHLGDEGVGADGVDPEAASLETRVDIRCRLQPIRVLIIRVGDACQPNNLF